MKREDIALASGPRGCSPAIWAIDSSPDGPRISCNSLRRMTWAQALEFAQTIREMHATSPLLKLYREDSR